MHWFIQFLKPGKVGPGGGYWFWSGIGSGSPIFIVAIGWLRHHNCHEHRCWRPGHPDADGKPVCRKHR